MHLQRTSAGFRAAFASSPAPVIVPLSQNKNILWKSLFTDLLELIADAAGVVLRLGARDRARAAPDAARGRGEARRARRQLQADPGETLGPGAAPHGPTQTGLRAGVGTSGGPVNPGGAKGFKTPTNSSPRPALSPTDFCIFDWVPRETRQFQSSTI